MSDRGDPRAGFTLLEVLVATVILAGGAAVLLGQIRQIFDYVARANGHQTAVRVVLNDSARIILERPESLSRSLTADRLALYRGSGTTPVAAVENHPYNGARVPIDVGFAPFQDLTIPPEGRWTLTLVMPALPRES